MNQLGSKLLTAGGVFLTIGGGLLGGYAVKQDINSRLAQPLPDPVFQIALWVGLATVVLGLSLMVLAYPIEYGLRAGCLTTEVFKSILVGKVEFVCRPATIHELKPAREFCMKALNSDDFTSLRKMQQWHGKNPRLLWLVREKAGIGKPEGRIVGYFSVIPLTKAAAQEVRAEELNGLHFTTSHILAPAVGKSRKTPYSMYLGAIAAVGTRARAATTRYLTDYLLQEKGQGGQFIYSRPITPDGLRLIKQYGFQPVDPTAVDQMERIYCLDLTTLPAGTASAAARASTGRTRP